MNIELYGMVHEHGGMSYLRWQKTVCGHPHYLTKVVYEAQEVVGSEVPLARVVTRPVDCLDCIAGLLE